MSWDVQQYERYSDERARPFMDLLARLPLADVQTAVDLGCGTGELTALLLDRYPDVKVTGVDSSVEMLTAAVKRTVPVHLLFKMGDAATWKPEAPVDLVVSNALMQWLDDHDTLLDRWSAFVAPGGVMAVQMPGNFDAPSHTLLAEVRADGPWAETLAGMERGGAVHDPSWYAEKLASLGFEHVDAWETTYVHVLQGKDAVLEWIKGTALRPVLAKLSAGDRPLFLETLGARLREAYPQRPYGTLFPFRRIFFVAARAA